VGIPQVTDTDEAGGRFMIVGGAGFLGSHFCDQLMSEPETAGVTVFDNFSSGQEWHVAHHAKDPRFHLLRADVADVERLTEAMTGCGTIIHLAANPDIARAVTEPDIDFREGTMLTRNLLEAMRATGCRRLLYASGSGVYGNLGEAAAVEGHVDIRPESTYGASKLACEALIASYCHMFDLQAYSFRFANVVGARQTHGVGYDFLRKLRADPSRLKILGDGSQSKSYLHADDTVAAVLHVYRHAEAAYDVYNVATGDYLSVTEIADMAVTCLGLNPETVRYDYTGGDRGWKGDIPVVRFNTDKLQALGWKCRNSSRDAFRRSLDAMRDQLAAGEAD